jgi:hypothetical protein
MLRLEFLPSGSPQSPLLRISGDDRDACTQLKEAFEQLADERLDTVCINDLSGILAVDDCV